MNFDFFIDSILLAEGGYVNDPSDRGGETMFGITREVARLNGYFGPMKEMPESLARAIYRKRYISEPAFDKVALINERVAGELIDTGVNMGPATAAMFLQRWLNAFNDTGSRYSKLFVDGRIGSVTLSALQSFLKWRKEGETVMMRALNSVQAVRYLDIAERDDSQKRFIYGWLLNRVVM